MNLTETVKKYNEAGIQCLPTKKDKSPLNVSTWKDGCSLDSFKDTHGIGIVCGKASGNIECLDFDNHQGNAKDNLTAFIDIPEVKEIYTEKKLVIEKTLSGGFHIIYRCPVIEGNRKLASSLFEGKPDCFIETRGEGGYFCVAPTPNYEILRGNIFKIPTITEIDRAILIGNALSMNTYYPPVAKTEYEGSDRPGDIYNDSVSTTEVEGILEGAGWKKLDRNKWRRPGKKEGISATLGVVAKNIFYCFTSNGYPFEGQKAYTPFQVLGLIKFNGDFSACAKSITPERPQQVQQKPYGAKELAESEIEKILARIKIDTHKTVERPPVIFSIKEREGTRSVERRVFTLGNFSCIIGKAKSRKTFFLSLITSILLSSNKHDKLLGSMPADKNEILFFDTEQSEFDSYDVIKRIETLAGTGLRLKAFNLREFSPLERCQIIEYALKIYGEKTGFCVIDGIADLANAINDEDEATRVVTILLRLTKTYNCHIATVLHQNKNDNYATGHLGSAVMKKAEVVISVSTPEEVTEINCDYIRGSAGFDTFEMTVSSEGVPSVGGLIKKTKKEKDEATGFYDPKEEKEERKLVPMAEALRPEESSWLNPNERAEEINTDLF